MTALPRDIPALTGLRSVAAWWVVLGHFGPWVLTLPGAALLSPVIHSGHIGVDIFFVLSGFILAHNYLRRFQGGVSGAGWVDFLRQRLARIYPTHLVTLLLMLGLVTLLGPLDTPGHYTAEAFVANVFLVHAWGGPGLWSWNYPAWSISCEWAAYLVFPALAWGAVRVRSGPAALGLALLGLTFMLVGMFLTARADLEVAQPLIRIAGEFTAGVLLYRAVQLGALEWLRGAWASAAAALGVVAVAATAVAVGVDALVAVPFAAFLIPALALSTGPLGRWLSSPGFVYWGQVSFGLYMVHGIVELLARRFLPAAEFATFPLWERLGGLAALLLLVIAAARLSHRFVEEPARKWLRGPGARATPPGDPAAPKVTGTP